MSGLDGIKFISLLSTVLPRYFKMSSDSLPIISQTLVGDKADHVTSWRHSILSSSKVASFVAANRLEPGKTVHPWTRVMPEFREKDYKWILPAHSRNQSTATENVCSYKMRSQSLLSVLYRAPRDMVMFPVALRASFTFVPICSGTVWNDTSFI